MGDTGILTPFQIDAAWHFFADGKLYGPYELKETAVQRWEDYLAYRTYAPGCHCAGDRGKQ